MEYKWEFGSLAATSTLHFTISYNDSTQSFTVVCDKGSFSLGALWFSDGDSTKDVSTLSLSKSDNSLNMNGTSTAWADDGTTSQQKIVWDDYAITNKTISQGSTVTFSLSSADQTELNTFISQLSNPQLWELGVRSLTSTGSNDGFKWVDTQALLHHEPTNITLSASNVRENAAASTVIATLGTTDQDVGETFTYKLVAGNGTNDADNGLVEIVGNELRVKGGINFETNPSLQINIQVTDSSRLSYTKALTVNVSNLDEVAPTITSGGTAAAINENSGAGQVIYTATATDALDISAGVTFSLKAGSDAGLTIDSSSGKVTLTDDPNYEGQSVYHFTVLASDGVNPATEQAVTLNINNLDEVAPTITSGATAPSIAENSGANQVIYTAMATDVLDISAGVTFNLKTGSDVGLSINALTGAVILAANPDYETKSSYHFTVLASDGVNSATEQAVTVNVTNVNDPIGTVTDINSAVNAINENSTGLVGITAHAVDPDAGSTVSYSLVNDISGLTAYSGSYFSIDSSSGNVSVSRPFDYETDLHTQTLYVKATSSDSSFSVGTFSLTLNDILEDPNDNNGQATSLTAVNIVDDNTGHILRGSYLNDTIDGAGGDDTIYGGLGNDTLLGGNGTDAIYGGGGDDQIDAGGNNDVLVFGGSGNDTISGGNSNDILTGGYGNDILNLGDGGKDTINYLSVLDGNDAVNGFDATSGGQDVLNMAALFDNYGTLSGTRESHISVTASGNNTVVNVDTDNNTSTWEMSITLTNVAVANITIGTDIIVV